jgi:hypothetical protein
MASYKNQVCDKFLLLMKTIFNVLFVLKEALPNVVSFVLSVTIKNIIFADYFKGSNID